MSSYAYSTKMPKALRQPITLAILGSLGIHGLLWPILLILPLAPKPSVVQQSTVGVVELTPTEQGRLPQLTPSPLDNKQVNNSQPTLPESSLPPPLPPESSVLPPLPPPLPPSSVLPPLPPLPSTGSSVPPSIIYPPIANLKPRLDVPPPPPSSLVSPSTLPKQQSIKLSSLPTNPNKVREPKLQHRELLQPSFSPPVNTGLPSLGGIKPAPFSPPPATALNPLPQKNNQSQNQQTAVANPESTTPTQPEASDRSRRELLRNLENYRRRRELLANLGEYQAKSEQTTTANTRKETPTNAQQQLGTQQPFSTAADRSEPRATPLPDSNPVSSMSLAEKRNAQITSLRDWWTGINHEEPGLVARHIQAPIDVCQKLLDGRTAIADVVVKPQGTIKEGPKIVLGQVAPSVEQDAEQDTEAYLRNYRFPPTEKVTDYHLSITYRYSPSSCSEANIKPTTNQTNNRQFPPENPDSTSPSPATDRNSNQQSTPELHRSTKRRLQQLH